MLPWIPQISNIVKEQALQDPSQTHQSRNPAVAAPGQAELDKVQLHLRGPSLSDQPAVGVGEHSFYNNHILVLKRL